MFDSRRIKEKDEEIAELRATVRRLRQHRVLLSRARDECTQKANRLEAQLQSAEERAEFYRKRAEELLRELDERSDRTKYDNLARLAAEFASEDEKENPPVPGALPLSGLADRIGEIWGDSLSIDDLIKRNQEYQEKHADDA